MRPGHDERIAHLFKRGHSLDLVAELGLLYGWTREEAKRVLAAKGWALDWSGRLQVQYMKEAMPVAGISVAQADPERLLNAGIDHEDADIRKMALTAERAVERLRALLMTQEQRDAERAAQSIADAFQVVLGKQAPKPMSQTH